MQDLFTVTLQGITCANCGCVFGLTTAMIRELRESRKTFHCPNAHPQWFPGESDAEKLKRQLVFKEAQLDQVRADRDQQIRKLKAAKGVATKLKNRIAAGVCPCCTRTFKNVARHIKDKHPAYVTSKPNGMLP